MINIFHTHFNGKFTDQAWDEYFRKMPESIQDRISRLKRWQDRQLGLLGKVLLLEGLKKYGYPPDCLNHLSYTGHNRPFIDQSIDFNISHSGNRVVCALSGKGKVGIDIEAVKPVSLSDFENYLNTEQWRSVWEAPDRLEKFFDIWTTQESVIKVDGRGLNIPLSDIRINGEKVTVCSKVWHVKSIEIHSGYKCRLATNLETPLIQISEFKISGNS